MKMKILWIKDNFNLLQPYGNIMEYRKSYVIMMIWIKLQLNFVIKYDRIIQNQINRNAYWLDLRFLRNFSQEIS